MAETYIVGSEKIPVQVVGNGLPDPITLVQDISVAAGATAIAVSSYSVKDALSFSIGISCDAGAPNVTVEIQPIVNGLVSTSTGVQKIFDNQILNNRRGVTNKYELSSRDFRVNITNHSSETRVFTLHLYKSYNKENQSINTKMEYYGATETQRPLPNSVPVGAVYMAVSTQLVWQSNGTEWIKL